MVTSNEESSAAETALRAATQPLEPADALRTASDSDLSEDLALALLKRSDLPADVLQQLGKNATALKSRKVRIALASHPHTPRHVSVPMARQFYTFDLMKVALSPGVPADVKVAIENVLISRIETVTAGERLTLARRASGRVTAALLHGVESARSKQIDRETVFVESRIIEAALGNPRLTEALVVESVLRPAANAAVIHAVARHAKWSPRREIRAALLRTEHLSPASALEFSRDVPLKQLQEIIASSRLPEQVKHQIRRQCERENGGVSASATRKLPKC